MEYERQDAWAAYVHTLTCKQLDRLVEDFVRSPVPADPPRRWTQNGSLVNDIIGWPHYCDVSLTRAPEERREDGWALATVTWIDKGDPRTMYEGVGSGGTADIAVCRAYLVMHAPPDDWQPAVALDEAEQVAVQSQ